MKIAIIGQGNVAWHLVKRLSENNDVVQINSRTLEFLPDDADLYLVSVSDDAILSVIERMPKLNGVLTHTSGTTDITVLDCFTDRPGVWYPLQTFTKGSALEYSKIPVFIEATNQDDLNVLRKAAESFSGNVYEAESNRRRRLHVASVFACNYINHLWKLADDILKADGMSLDIMLPLIDATTEKVHHLSPAAAQTGPASRGDTIVTNVHKLWLADNNPDLVQLYTILEKSIIKHKQDIK